MFNSGTRATKASPTPAASVDEVDGVAEVNDSRCVDRATVPRQGVHVHLQTLGGRANQLRPPATIGSAE
eukprot:4037264-Alexandrium_andersonii.AAC.1